MARPEEDTLPPGSVGRDLDLAAKQRRATEELLKNAADAGPLAHVIAHISTRQLAMWEIVVELHEKIDKHLRRQEELENDHKGLKKAHSDLAEQVEDLGEQLEQRLSANGG